MGCIPSPSICTGVYPARSLPQPAGAKTHECLCRASHFSPALWPPRQCSRPPPVQRRPCVPFPACRATPVGQKPRCAEPGAGARRCRGSARLQPHPNASSHTSQMGLAVPGMQLSCSRCKSTSGGLECLSGFVLEWFMLSPIFLSLLNTLLLGMVSKIDVAI